MMGKKMTDNNEIEKEVRDAIARFRIRIDTLYNHLRRDVDKSQRDLVSEVIDVAIRYAPPDQQAKRIDEVMELVRELGPLALPR